MIRSEHTGAGEDHRALLREGLELRVKRRRTLARPRACRWSASSMAIAGIQLLSRRIANPFAASLLHLGAGLRLLASLGIDERRAPPAMPTAGIRPASALATLYQLFEPTRRPLDLQELGAEEEHRQLAKASLADRERPLGEALAFGATLPSIKARIASEHPDLPLVVGLAQLLRSASRRPCLPVRALDVAELQQEIEAEVAGAELHLAVPDSAGEAQDLVGAGELSLDVVRAEALDHCRL